MRALCVGKPPDWWEVPDDGNRLALMLCSVCPAQQLCADQARAEAGIVRAGVAYADTGDPLNLCNCGRPVPYPGRADCYTCHPSNRTTVPKPVPRRLRGRPRRLDDHLAEIADLVAAGWSSKRIGQRLEAPPSTVRLTIQRHGLREQVAA